MFFCSTVKLAKLAISLVGIIAVCPLLSTTLSLIHFFVLLIRLIPTLLIKSTLAFVCSDKEGILETAFKGVVRFSVLLMYSQVERGYVVSLASYKDCKIERVLSAL